MKKIIFLFLFFLAMTNVKLYTRPIGLANCGNTCFQNAFIQMIYHVDPLIDILSNSPNLYAKDTLGYTFQHLVWDIINAQRNNKSFIECGSADNPTNLKKLTEGVYNCIKREIGSQQGLFSAFNVFLEELEKTSSKELASILTIPIEETDTTINVPGVLCSESIREFSHTPIFTLASSSAAFENDIRDEFNISTYSTDPQTGIEHETFNRVSKLLSVPKFIVFMHQFTFLKSSPIRNYFPDTLNLTKYIKGHSQALYQLRAIAVYTPFRVGVGGSYSGHYIAVVRDRDGKLYKCNDSSITHVNSWQEGIGTHDPASFLYVLKTTKQDFSGSDILLNKLNKLKKSLKNLEYALHNF